MSTKAKWNNGILTYYENVKYESFPALAPVQFYDDFLNTVFMTAAAGVVGWTVKDTGSNVAPVILANQPGGVIRMGHDATNEKQESGIYWGDALNWNLDAGPIFECRANINVLPTLQTEIYFGFANAYVEGPIAEADAGPTIHAFFCFDGGGACTIHTDDTSTDNNAVSTGITVVADTYHVYRIDCSDVTSVKFYIDGARVAGTTTFNMANGTNVVVQPFIMSHKETSAGLGMLYIDYVKVWSPR